MRDEDKEDGGDEAKGKEMEKGTFQPQLPSGHLTNQPKTLNTALK